MKKIIIVLLIFAGLFNNTALLCMEEGNKGFQEKKEEESKKQQEKNTPPSLKQLALENLAAKMVSEGLQDIKKELPTKLKKEIAQVISEKINLKKLVENEGLIKIINDFGDAFDGKVLFSPDGSKAIQLFGDQIILYEIKKEGINELQKLELKNAQNYSQIIFSSDNRSFGLVSRNKQFVALYQLDKHNEWRCIGNLYDEFYIAAVIFSPDAQQLFFVSEDAKSNRNFLCNYNIKIGKVTILRTIHYNDSERYQGTDLKFISNDTLIVGFDQSISIYKIEYANAELLYELVDEITNLSKDSSSYLLAFEVKGEELFCSLSDRTFNIYNLKTKKITYSKKLDKKFSINSIYLGQDDILVLNAFKNIYICNAKNRKLDILMQIDSPTIIRNILVNPKKTMVLFYNSTNFVICDIRNPKNVGVILNYDCPHLRIHFGYSVSNQAYIHDKSALQGKLLLCDLNAYEELFEKLTIKKALELLEKYKKIEEEEELEEKKQDTKKSKKQKIKNFIKRFRSVKKKR